MKQIRNRLKTIPFRFFVVLLLGCFFLLFGSNFLLTSYAYTIELPSTLTSGMDNPLTDWASLFTSGLSEEEMLRLTRYYATDDSGTEHTVYCLEKSKNWDSNLKLVRDGQILDQGYVYIMKNGYPAKSFTGTKKYDSYLTQVAIWFYQDRAAGVSDSSNGVLTAKQKTAIKASTYYTNYISKLLDGAMEAKNNTSVVDPTITVTSKDFKLSSDHTYMITDVIGVSSNVDFDNYNVSVSNNAIQVLGEDNSVISGSINKGKGFKLKLNLKDITSPTPIKVNVTINYSSDVAYSYSPEAQYQDEIQKVIVSTLVTEPKQKTTDFTLSIPTGSITVEKIEKGTSTHLVGANFEITRVLTSQVIGSFKTDASKDQYVTDNLLPGEYEIKELEAPAGYFYENQTTKVVITDEALSIVKQIENTKRRVTIRKVDKESGQPIAGAVLKILDHTNEEVKKITTIEGDTDISDLTEGTYKVVEESAPDGYIVNTEEKSFTIGNDTSVLNVSFEDEKNKVIIQKLDADDNSVLAGATLQVINTDTNETVETFQTTKEDHIIRGLKKGHYKIIETYPPKGYQLSSSEVTFEITDNQTEVQTLKFYNSKNQIEINKIDSETKEAIEGAELEIIDGEGKTVEKFKTEKIPHSVQSLSVGHYKVRETKSADGYVLNKSEVDFEVKEDTKSLIVTFENTKKELKLQKVDSQTNALVAGAKLKLTDERGNLIKEFVTSTTPESIKGIKNGTYYLEETEAPKGYVRSKEKKKIVIQDSDAVVTYSMPNSKINVRVKKVDSYTMNPISGVILELLDAKKEKIESFTTTDTPYVLQGLSEGTYYIKEEKSKDGYVLDSTLHSFVIDDTNYDFEVIIKNKPISVSLGKIDALTNSFVEGATLELTRLDGDMDPIRFISGKEAKVITGIPLGIYSLKEIEAPKGYIGTNAEIVFELLNTGQMQLIRMSSEFVTITTENKKLKIDTKGSAGYTFELENRKTKEKEEIVVGAEVYESDILEEGDYSLKEIKTPSGVNKNNAIYYFSITNDNKRDVITITNDVTKVAIYKKDIKNDQTIKGARISIKDSEGNVIEEFLSTEEEHYLERLAVGTYTLTEEIAPEGYILNPATVTFEVKEIGDLQTVSLFNEKPIDVPDTYQEESKNYGIAICFLFLGGILTLYYLRRKKA